MVTRQIFVIESLKKDILLRQIRARIGLIWLFLVALGYVDLVCLKTDRQRLVIQRFVLELV